MMNSRPARNSRGRVLGGAAVLLFLAGVIFAPIVSAFALCTMPCCHQSAATSVSAGGSLPCPLSRCTIAKAPAEVATIAPQVSPSAPHAALLETAAVSEIAPAVDARDDRLSDADSPSRSRPLHLVNSVFLI